MTDLIPRADALTFVNSKVTNSGYSILGRRIEQGIAAIPAIDPAAIREAAQALEQECPWRDDTESYREWHEDRRAIATRLLALIGEKK